MSSVVRGVRDRWAHEGEHFPGKLERRWLEIGGTTGMMAVVDGAAATRGEKLRALRALRAPRQNFFPLTPEPLLPSSLRLAASYFYALLLRSSPRFIRLPRVRARAFNRHFVRPVRVPRDPVAR